MAAAGELSGHSIPQLRQLLVTVFGLLFGAGLSVGPPGTSATQGTLGAGSSSGFGLSSSSSSAAATGNTSIRVLSLLKELKECPLLPLYGQKGVLVPARAAAEGEAGSSSSSTAGTVFFPGEESVGQAAPAGKSKGGRCVTCCFKQHLCAAHGMWRNTLSCLMLSGLLSMLITYKKLHFQAHHLPPYQPHCMHVW
jgi:hypothetical protein